MEVSSSDEVSECALSSSETSERERSVALGAVAVGLVSLLVVLVGLTLAFGVPLELRKESVDCAAGPDVRRRLEEVEVVILSSQINSIGVDVRRC